MLPKELNSEIGSLVEGQPRLALSIFIRINDEGLLDYDSIEFKESII
jgi:exoribonuclease R